MQLSENWPVEEKYAHVNFRLFKIVPDSLRLAPDIQIRTSEGKAISYFL